MNFILSFKLNNWLNLTINLFNSARFNRKIVLQTRKVSADNLRLRHKKLVADSWFWHVTVLSDVSAIAADSQKVQAEYKFEIFLRQLSFDMKQRSLHQQNLASKNSCPKLYQLVCRKRGMREKASDEGENEKLRISRHSKSSILCFDTELAMPNFCLSVYLSKNTSTSRKTVVKSILVERAGRRSCKIMSLLFLAKRSNKEDPK